MKLSLCFGMDWFFSDGGIHASIISRTANKLREEFEENICEISANLNRLQAIYNGDLSCDDLRKSIEGILYGLTGKDDLETICSIEIDGCTSTTKTTTPIEESGSAVSSENHEENQCEELALDQIRQRIGNEDLICLSEEIHERAPVVIRNKTQSIFFSEAYLFSCNTGSGFNSAINLLSRQLYQDGLFESELQPIYYSLPESGIGNISEEIINACHKQRIVVIDISKWVGHTGKPELKGLLLRIFKNNTGAFIVFKMPLEEHDIIARTQTDLEDIITIHPVVFSVFSKEEIRKIATQYLSTYHFSLEDAAWEIFDSRIAQEMEDGFFYGIHTVRKVLNEYIHSCELRESKTITVADAGKGLDEQIPETDPLDELRQMIGMNDVLGQVIEMINQLLYVRKTSGIASPTMHMCFLGNPGTGKTSVARIIGKVLKQHGVLRLGNFYEHHGRDLCGKYVGETAPKTASICEEAYGSVLFIDEAYSLAQNDRGWDYGTEAVDMLITQMENHSDDLLVIFSGYEDDMARLFDMNAGLSSRVPYIIHFPNYNQKQLAEIFRKLVLDHFEGSDALFSASDAYFASLPDEMVSDKHFGNARYVRNIYERVWSKAINRSAGTGRVTLTQEDFLASVSELGVAVKRSKSLGFLSDK